MINKNELPNIRNIERRTTFGHFRDLATLLQRGLPVATILKYRYRCINSRGGYKSQTNADHAKESLDWVIESRNIPEPTEEESRKVKYFLEKTLRRACGCSFTDESGVVRFTMYSNLRAEMLNEGWNDNKIEEWQLCLNEILSQLGID